MSKRLLLLMVVVLTGVVLLLSWNRPTHRIDRESFARIEVGMTKQAVEAILNCGPGDHGNTPLNDGSDFPLANLHKILDLLFRRATDHQSESELWVSDECVILIYFNDQDMVRYKVFESRSQSGIVPIGEGETFWAKVQRVMGFGS
jgi:hypothetical protein